MKLIYLRILSLGTQYINLERFWMFDNSIVKIWTFDNVKHWIECFTNYKHKIHNIIVSLTILCWISFKTGFITPYKKLDIVIIKEYYKIVVFNKRY